MKLIGLVGGTSWVSTIDYYRHINKLVYKKTEGESTAEIMINSVNYPVIARLTAAGKWEEISVIISKAALALEEAGARCILIGANTMHNVAPQVASILDVPLLDICEETGQEIIKKGLKKVALLGTRYTMELPFYKNKLAQQNIETIIPSKDDVKLINEGIYKELALGIITTETKIIFLKIMDKLKVAGAGGIILGCTEIPMLIKQEDFDLPLFDTTLIHAQAAVNFALS